MRRGLRVGGFQAQECFMLKRYCNRVPTPWALTNGFLYAFISIYFAFDLYSSPGTFTSIETCVFILYSSARVTNALSLNLLSFLFKICQSQKMEKPQKDVNSDKENGFDLAESFCETFLKSASSLERTWFVIGSYHRHLSVIGLRRNVKQVWS